MCLWSQNKCVCKFCLNIHWPINLLSAYYHCYKMYFHYKYMCLHNLQVFHCKLAAYVTTAVLVISFSCGCHHNITNTDDFTNLRIFLIGIFQISIQFWSAARIYIQNQKKKKYIPLGIYGRWPCGTPST